MVVRIAFVIFSVLITSRASLAEKAALWGYPIVTKYGAAELQDSPACYCFCPLPDGSLLIGGQGLHQFDGDRWTFTPTNFEAIYGLDYGEDGRVWVGALGEVGWFSKESDGKWLFHSINSAVDLRGQVWRILSVDGGAVFCTADRVYWWDGEEAKSWSVPSNGWLYLFRMAGQMFVSSATTGLYKVTKEGPKLVIPVDQFGGAPSYIMSIDAEREHWLLATTKGIFVYRDGKVMPRSNPNSDFASHKPNCGVLLRDGRYAFGSYNSRVIITDHECNIIELIGEESGLPRTIDRVYADRYDQLWIASREGIFRVNLDPQTRIFDRRAGINTSGAAYDSMAAAAGRVGITSLSAAYFSSGTRQFTPLDMPGIAPHTITTASSDSFYVCGSKRLWLYSPSGRTEIARTSPDFLTAIPSVSHPGEILACDYTNVKVVSGDGSARNIVTNLRTPVTCFAEDQTDNLIWLGGASSGLFAVDPDTRTPQEARPPDERFGLPAFSTSVEVRATPEGDVLVLASTGAWIKRSGARTFAAIPGFLKRPVSAVSNVLGDGSLWIAYSATSELAPALWRLVTQPSISCTPYSFDGFDAMGPPRALLAQQTADGLVLWIGGTSVLRHEVRLSSAPRPPRSPILNVYVREGRDYRHRLTDALPYSTTSVQFEFSQPEFSRRRLLRLQTRISTLDSDWIPANKDSTRELTAIRDGTYTFQVRAVAETGLVSEPTSFTFTVLPPWWRTTTALWLEGIGFAGLLFGGFRWRDRTLRKRNLQLEHKVAQRTTELKKANEAKDEFLASMSHEIRNPLNGVIGIAGMIRDSAAGARDRQLADSLHACADQLRLVLDDVLDFSRIERGEIEIHHAPFDPAAVVRIAAIAVDVTLERTRIATSPEIAGRWVRGDEGKVRQIVSNLVSNAHKYGVPPEADIHVTYRDGRLEIAVSNTGPDIPAEDQARIFGSFERGRTQSHKYVSGVGLGLTISSRFAQAMGGTLTVESASGMTTFTFSAPMDPAEKPASDAAATTSGPRGRALAVEDESYNRLVLGHELTQLGFAVDWAQNATEAIELFRSGSRYDVVFTDWMLPDKSGAELVRTLQQIGGPATPPIIAVTAYATAEKRAEAVAAGVAGFITKPITREKIAAALPTAVDGHAPTGAPDSMHGSLRFGVLLDGENPAERIEDFRAQLQRRMDEIDGALAVEHADEAVRAAHQLASQVLSLHHHPFADQLRALEQCASRKEWDKARELQVANRESAIVLGHALARLAATAARIERSS